MRYTAEQIMPKRYPENKPSEEGKYIAHNARSDEWITRLWKINNPWWNYIDWFIPYRLAPVSNTDELEPFTDERLLLELINRNVLGEASSVTERCVPFNEVVVGIGNDEVAYITFPKEAFGALCDLVYEPLGNSEQLERDEMDVIWRADDTVLSSSKDNVILKNTRNGETDKIVIWKHAFTETCLHWLDLQGYDVTEHIDQPPIKGRVLWHDEHIEITDLDGFDDTFMIASVTNPERYVFVTDEQLSECYCAVEAYEPEPEIKACPNPECREKCNMDDEGYEEENEYYLHCEICGYCSPIAYNPEEAIRLHNLIAGKAD